MFNKEAGQRLVAIDFTSDFEGAAAEGFAIHSACSLGIGVNIRT
jgi:hypothetical protein